MCAKCMECGPDKHSGVWCDPCWDTLKAKVLKKYSDSKAKNQRKSANAKAIAESLGLEG